MRRQIWLVIGALSVMGCATIFPPVEERVLLQSQPPGATVSINGEVRGVTPLSVPLSCDPAPVVRMELEGFQPVEHPMPRHEGFQERLGLAWVVEKCVGTFAVVLLPQRGGQ